MAPLTIHGNIFEPDPAGAASEARSTDFVIVQTQYPLTHAEQSSLRAIGAKYEQELAINTYLFCYDPADLSFIRALPFVKFVDIYHSHFKLLGFEQYGIAPRTLETEGTEAVTGSPQIASPSAGVAGTSAASAADAGAESAQAAAGTITAADTPATSPNDPIWIAICLHNNATETASDVANNMVQSGLISLETTDIISPIRLDTKAAPADVPKIAAIDSVALINPYEEKNDKIDVARTVLNACVYTPDWSTEYTGQGQVVAVGDSGFDIGNKNNIHPGFVAGSVLDVTNVWGVTEGLDDTTGHGTHGTIKRYNNEAGDIDDFTFKNQDAFVSKNLTVVGACDTTRPNIAGKYDPTKPIDNSPYRMAQFSNRGPAPEGRFKPDVVAPGMAILSAKSRNATNQNDVTWGLSNDPNLTFSAGTSAATPQVAGCAAVIREALVKRSSNPVAKPSGALVKALLINGAVPLDPSSVVPNNVSGFGRVNLEASLAHLEIPDSDPNVSPRCGFFTREIAALKTFEVATIKVPPLEEIPLTGEKIPRRLRVTLVWFDVRGASTENKLYLTLAKKGGTSKQAVCGNRDPNATDGTTQTPDRVNTVQRVDCVNISPGEYSASVTCEATSLAVSKVEFHVAWYLF
ncbi:Subtilisin-like protein [Coniochaeta hoffmannii]|uniref:Subtilisin-like protein n=1 Tax=Coniochaeta hoffmannii TaxID=91930 RepID=A0AA38VXM3_9PEZI|nr:Subtilisin-like protein [Coniochaeta hoffmannii]